MNVDALHYAASHGIMPYCIVIFCSLCTSSLYFSLQWKRIQDSEWQHALPLIRAHTGPSWAGEQIGTGFGVGSGLVHLEVQRLGKY